MELLMLAKKINLILMNIHKTLKFWFTFPLSISGSVSIFVHGLTLLCLLPPASPFPYPLVSFWSELLIPRNIFKVSLWVNIPILFIPSRAFLLNDPSCHIRNIPDVFLHILLACTLSQSSSGDSPAAISLALWRRVRIPSRTTGICFPVS